MKSIAVATGVRHPVMSSNCWLFTIIAASFATILGNRWRCSRGRTRHSGLIFWVLFCTFFLPEYSPSLHLWEIILQGSKQSKQISHLISDSGRRLWLSGSEWTSHTSLTLIVLAIFARYTLFFRGYIWFRCSEDVWKLGMLQHICGMRRFVSLIEISCDDKPQWDSFTFSHVRFLSLGLNGPSSRRRKICRVNDVKCFWF